ncbi:MAG: deoxyguanosinetriphosphate triphosphohydrolase [Ignavibacteriaceae bacterium]
MEWTKLLNSNRPEEKTGGYNITSDGRSEYQRDFDRIVFCSAFRRLQDKTQVFPLPETDFVHTRLTHSLEVSVVGRSLGNLAGEKILARHTDLKKEFSNFDFGEIVAAASLAHDIGNPPFGHSGEDAIAEYFLRGNGSAFESKIKDRKKWSDLIKFEGNAQGFRILTKLQNPLLRGGLRLTFATLASLTKYPNESFFYNSPAKHLSESYRKFGFFQAEKELFREIADATGLLNRATDKDDYCWCRHPLAFLVEAADDICYRIMDLEDGFRLGLVTFDETEQLLASIIKNKKFRNYQERDEENKIGYLRAKAIGELVREIAEVFISNEENLLSGKFDSALISQISSSDILEEIMNLSVKKIYRYESVIEREAAGFEVLAGLLDIYIEAINELATGHLSARNKTIVGLLPEQFIGTNKLPEADLYERLLRILDYVSGMTDSFAVSIFRKMRGISLPGGRINF